MTLVVYSRQPLMFVTSLQPNLYGNRKHSFTINVPVLPMTHANIILLLNHLNMNMKFHRFKKLHSLKAGLILQFPEKLLFGLKFNGC